MIKKIKWSFKLNKITKLNRFQIKHKILDKQHLNQIVQWIFEKL